MTDKLKVLDLFSGIGGFSLGLERTGGFETVAFCEIDKFCQKVLKKHWPDVPIYNDVRILEHDGPVDIITGGYPCQPESNARQHQEQTVGIDDTRWLWPEVDRLLDVFRPDWFVGENVYNHINMGLDIVLAALEGKNYTTRAFIIPAASVGATHRRDRVWICANSNSKRRDGLDKSIKNRCSRFSVPRMEQRRVYRPDNISVPLAQRYNNPRSGIFRNDDGLSEGMDRLKGLGNAVVPQIPEMIGNAILLAEGIEI